VSFLLGRYTNVLFISVFKTWDSFLFNFWNKSVLSAVTCVCAPVRVDVCVTGMCVRDADLADDVSHAATDTRSVHVRTFNSGTLDRTSRLTTEWKLNTQRSHISIIIIIIIITSSSSSSRCRCRCSRHIYISISNAANAVYAL